MAIRVALALTLALLLAGCTWDPQPVTVLDPGAMGVPMTTFAAWPF